MLAFLAGFVINCFLLRRTEVAYLTQYSNSIPVIKYHIDQVLMTLGQDIDMDICVPEDSIAANHASIEAIRQQSGSFRFIIKSREDESQVQLNGEIVTHAELQDGDWLLIGDIEFQFTDDGVNSIVEDVTQVQPVAVEAEELTLAENTESEALQLVKELKQGLQDEIIEEEKPLSTKEFIENSRRSRPRFVIN